jgi:hypothetical protein
MITPAYALTASERVLPRLALDFTTAALDARVTFTRTGATATRVNSSGYIETVAADIARFDFDPITLACKGLLIEESRVNGFEYSESVNSWPTKTNFTITDDEGIGPDGIASASLIQQTVGGSTVDLTAPLYIVTSGVTYTVSFFAKAKEITTASFRLSNTSAWVRPVFTVNMATGAITLTAGNATVRSENYGDGWYRYFVTATVTGATSGSQFQLASSTSLTPNDGDGFYLTKCQWEAGAFGTSYIPNDSTGTTTRNADVATMTGTNFSDWFNATEGTFVAETANLTTAAATRSIFDVRSGATARMSLQNFGTFASFAVVNSTTQASLDAKSDVAVGEYYRIAGSYKADDFAAAANGGSVVTDTSGTVPTANVAWIGGVNGTSVRNGWVTKILYYPQRLTNAEISAFSKQG